MAKDTLTLGLNGEVSLAIFAQAIPNLERLVSALSTEISKGIKIDWEIEDLHAGSATVTVKGVAEDTERVERVIRAYAAVGKALENSQPIPYSDNVTRPARAITDLLQDGVSSVRFETPDEEAIIFSPSVGPTKVRLSVAYGAVEGVIQTLSSRGSLRFVLYDHVYDRAVSCYLKEGQQEIMRDAWGYRAIIEGKIFRDPISGRPIIVREVTNVVKLSPASGNYTDARGAVPWQPGMPLPEDAIRQSRDA
jgi:hypothetical protein